MRKRKILVSIMFLTIFVACGDEAGGTEEAIKSLQEELALTDIDITNETSLFMETVDSSSIADTIAVKIQDEASQTVIEKGLPTLQVEMPVTEEELMVERVMPPPSPVAPEMIAPPIRRARDRAVKPRSQLVVVQQGSYIKVGNDRPGLSIFPNANQKITTVIFPKGRSAMVDIYLFAIPTTSPLVRNANTLIGYVKNVDFINGQAQFTKYWNRKRSNDTYVIPRNYNIYIDYYYKNAQGRVITREGRYWGGSHRRWYVKVR